MPITVHSIHSSINPKIIMPFSTRTIAEVALLFASGPIISSQQALAFVYVHGHAGFHHGHYFYNDPY
jgi:pectin methylesterase-like acyl-CoA thioesterase